MSVSTYVASHNAAKVASDFHALLQLSQKLQVLDPRNSQWMYSEFLARFNLNKLDELEDKVGFLRRCIHYNSMESELYFQISKAYTVQKNYKAALITSVVAMSLLPNHPEYERHHNLLLSQAGYDSVKVYLVNCDTIGHFVWEPDAWLRNYKINNQDVGVYHLFLMKNQCVNNVIKRIWVKNLNTLVDDYWYAHLYARQGIISQEFRASMPFDIRCRELGFSSYVEMNKEAYSITRSMKSEVELSDEDCVAAVKALRKYGVRDTNKLVCLHVRDAGYLKNKSTKDNSHHDNRDMDLDNYVLAIDFLIEQGYTVVRIGKDSNQYLDYAHERYIDMCMGRDEEFGELLDVFLQHTCTFLIGNSSGILFISALFNKPMLQLNAAPLFPPPVSNALFVPKIMLDPNGCEISFSYIFSELKFEFEGELYRVFESPDTAVFQESGYSFVENTSIDILEAVQEFEYKVTNSSTINRPSPTQQRYLESIPDNVWFKSFVAPISESFLIRHQRLFN